MESGSQFWKYQTPDGGLSTYIYYQRYSATNSKFYSSTANKVILITLTDHASFEKSDKLLYHLCTSLKPLRPANS